MRDAPQETPETTDRNASVPPDGPAHLAPGTDEPSTDAHIPRPQPKSAYELPSKKNTVLRNMVWALALTMAVVVVVGIAFFGVGSDAEREPLANSELDVAASAERAQEVAPFPVAVPELDEGWDERTARFTDGAAPQWTVQYTSPEGRLLTLVQQSELSAPMLASALPDSTVEEELSVDGAQCTVLSGGEEGAQETGIACEGDGWGFVVHGLAETPELEQLAGAAITALD